MVDTRNSQIALTTLPPVTLNSAMSGQSAKEFPAATYPLTGNPRLTRPIQNLGIFHSSTPIRELIEVTAANPNVSLGRSSLSWMKHSG
jgi:hypothetical protein